MKIAFLALLAITTIGLSACDDTWRGVGRDTQEVGQEIQRSSGTNN